MWTFRSSAILCFGSSCGCCLQFSRQLSRQLELTVICFLLVLWCGVNYFVASEAVPFAIHLTVLAIDIFEIVACLTSHWSCLLHGRTVRVIWSLDVIQLSIVSIFILQTWQSRQSSASRLIEIGRNLLKLREIARDCKKLRSQGFHNISEDLLWFQRFRVISKISHDVLQNLEQSRAFLSSASYWFCQLDVLLWMLVTFYSDYCLFANFTIFQVPFWVWWSWFDVIFYDISCNLAQSLACCLMTLTVLKSYIFEKMSWISFLFDARHGMLLPSCADV